MARSKRQAGEVEAPQFVGAEVPGFVVMPPTGEWMGNDPVWASHTFSETAASAWRRSIAAIERGLSNDQIATQTQRMHDKGFRIHAASLIIHPRDTIGTTTDEIRDADDGASPSA